MTRNSPALINPFPFAELTPHRLEAFFDAIFAIIMTILVLGLALPGQADDLSPAEICIAMIPQIIHFALAFFILAAFWGAHHRTFSLVTKLDPFLIRLTFILLFVACLIPFTSTLAGDNHTEGPAVLLFHANMLLLGLIFFCQWVYVNSSHLATPIPDNHYRFILTKSIIVPFVSILAIIMSCIEPSWSSICYFFIPVCELSLRHIKSRLFSQEVSENSMSQRDESVLLTLSPELCTSLDEVTHEMEISREDLIMHILSGWMRSHRVNTGPAGSLCQLNQDHPSESSGQSSTDINR